MSSPAVLKINISEALFEKGTIVLSDSLILLIIELDADPDDPNTYPYSLLESKTIVSGEEYPGLNAVKVFLETYPAIQFVGVIDGVKDIVGVIV